MRNQHLFDWSLDPYVDVSGTQKNPVALPLFSPRLLSQTFRRSSCEMGREGEQLFALPGPCLGSSCGGVLLVPPVGSGAGWPRQRENVSQVRGCPACQACLSAGKESGQWLVQELQQESVFCGQVSCGCCLPMGGNSLLSLQCSDSHTHCRHPAFLSHLLITELLTGLACLTLLVVKGIL